MYITTFIHDHKEYLAPIVSYNENVEEHLVKYRRISFFPGGSRTKSGMRVAKVVNIAQVDENHYKSAFGSFWAFPLAPFTTYGANLKYIDLQQEHPELFI